MSGNYQMSKAENDQDTKISNEVTNSSDNTNLKTLRFFNFYKDLYESIKCLEGTNVILKIKV